MPSSPPQSFYDPMRFYLLPFLAICCARHLYHHHVGLWAPLLSQPAKRCKMSPARQQHQLCQAGSLGAERTMVKWSANQKTALNQWEASRQFTRDAPKKYHHIIVKSPCPNCLNKEVQLKRMLNVDVYSRRKHKMRNFVNNKDLWFFSPPMSWVV